MNIDFTPSKTCTEFMNSDAKMRVLMGPVGSGKSVAAVLRLSVGHHNSILVRMG